MKKSLLFLVSFTLLYMLTGCWDQTEVNELSLVTGLGIDKGKEHKFLLTVEVLNPTALDPQTMGSETASIVFSQEGDSIGELAKKMNIGFTRKLIYSHMRIVAISKEIAQEGILEFIDFFEADREIRNDFNLILVDNVSAKDLLKVTYPIQRVSSLKIHRQLNTMIDEWGGDPDVRLKDFVNALVSRGREPVIVSVKVEGPIEKANKPENMSVVDPHALVVINGLSIFNKMKYQGTLPVKHARNYLLLQDKLRNTSITAPCSEKNIMTARILNSKTSVKARYENDLPRIDVGIDLEGRLDALQCPTDVSSIDEYMKIEKTFSEAFADEIKNTITMLQDDYQLDIFGFGEHMERQDHQNFKKVRDNWNEEFARAEINVNVHLKLRRAGLISDPLFEDINND